MKDRNGKINVGISIAAMEGGSIWDSGLNQNLAFLVMLLRQVDVVGEIFLVNGGLSEKLQAGLKFDAIGAKLVRPQEVTYQLDVMIEMGVTIQLEWLRHIKALGTRIVTFYVGHTYTGQAEPPIFGRNTGTTFIETPWTEIWSLPHHQKASAPMLRTLTRVPVREMPYLWSPIFVQQHIEETARGGAQFGFNPPKGAGWRVAIFEPNISVVKNCTIPMLATDYAYRKKAEAVQLMMVMNTVHMKEHPTFNHFAARLDLTRAGKATYEPRLAFVECMAVHKLDAVVAHQWECELNNSYYDALYGGYPLVHNSDRMRDEGVGLYYPGFEAKAGGEALLRAWESDPAFWQDYRSRAQKVLAKRSPDHADNIRAYRERLLDLVGGSR